VGWVPRPSKSSPPSAYSILTCFSPSRHGPGVRRPHRTHASRCDPAAACRAIAVLAFAQPTDRGPSASRIWHHLRSKRSEGPAEAATKTPIWFAVPAFVLLGIIGMPPKPEASPCASIQFFSPLAWERSEDSAGILQVAHGTGGGLENHRPNSFDRYPNRREGMHWISAARAPP
jgi:hypothetical protein